MAHAHLPKPSLRSPAVAGETYPGTAEKCRSGKCSTKARMLRGRRRSTNDATATGASKPRIGYFPKGSALSCAHLSAICFIGLFSCYVLNGQTGINAFKHFLQNTPPVGTLVAKVCTVEGTNNQTQCHYVLIRYQTNAFFYREAATLDDLNSTNVFPRFRFAGFYENEYWNYGYDGLSFEFSTNRDPSLVATLTHIIRKASVVINLGVFDLNPGLFSWRDNSIVPFTNQLGVSFQGGLINSNGGVPSSFQLITDYDGNRVPWEITYKYGETEAVPKYLPTTVLGNTVRDGVRHFKYEVSLIEVAIAEKGLTKNAFSPDGLFERVPYKILSTELGKFGSDKLNTTLTPIYATASTKKYTARILMLIISVIFLSTTAFFVWRKTARAN